MSKRDLISVVVPVFNEIDVVDSFYERIGGVFASLSELDHELLFVEDGSSDGTFERLSELADADPSVRILKFSRNFGHQIAITAGIDHVDVVYGVRTDRDGETRAKLVTARLFYRLLRRFTNVEIPADVGDFRLMSKAAADQFRRLREKDRFVRGLVSWVGFRQTGVPYAREARHAGETKYPYRKMVKFAIDGITSFSNAPLKLASWLGYLASILAFAYLVSVFIQKAMGGTVQGWATIMVGLLFFGGVQLICLGIIGEYIGRIFNEIKPRPMYIVEKVYAPGAPSEPEPEARAIRREPERPASVVP